MSPFVLFSDSTQKYDSRDVERLLRDDALVGSYLTWRMFVVDDTLKMIDDSFQWRKEFSVNGENKRRAAATEPFCFSAAFQGKAVKWLSGLQSRWF